MGPRHADQSSRSRSRRPRRSARLRLTVLYGGLFLLSGAALLAATYGLFLRATDYHAPRLPTVPEAPSIQSLQGPLAQALPRFEYAQQQLAEALPGLQSAPAPSAASVPQRLGPIQQQLASVQQQLSATDRQLAGAVDQLARAGSAESAQRTTDAHQLLVNSGIALAVVALLALLAGWLAAGRILRPIRTITRTARRISSTRLHERLALDGPRDELRELADTLDDLFARLDAAFEAQRRFVANASHELRTPLTRERTLVQVALADPSTPEVWRSTAQDLLASNRDQEVLIEALLTLASSEGGLDHREQVDLAEVCATAVERHGVDAGGGLQVESDLHPAPLDGDPRLVERLVSNLVDNAIGHNVAGGRVRISTGVTEGGAVVSVTNTGPVVPPGEVDRLFEPFQRLDGSRTHRGKGHGLGLSIVRAIATAHGATVTATAPPGGGMSVEVAFPAPAGPDEVPGAPFFSGQLVGT